MSVKSFIQIFILFLIISVVGGIYFKYFNENEKIIEEINTLETDNKDRLVELEKKISELESKNTQLSQQIEKNQTNFQPDNLKDESKIKNENEIINKDNSQIKNEKVNDTKDKKNEKKTVIKKKDIKNLVKDVEYTSIDQKGNKFILLANSGKSNVENKDILDLFNVRGRIISEIRDTIYIVSDFAQYNSVNLNSKFYENVIINYQDKQINCINFDINMETNMAIAYNNVVITNPKSTMKAGIVEFDLETKNININPETSFEEVQVITSDGVN